MVDSTTAHDHNQKKQSWNYFFRARADCPAVDDCALSCLPA